MLFALPSFIIDVAKFQTNILIYIINIDINVTHMCQIPTLLATKKVCQPAGTKLHHNLPVIIKTLNQHIRVFKQAFKIVSAYSSDCRVIFFNWKLM